MSRAKLALAGLVLLSLGQVAAAQPGEALQQAIAPLEEGVPAVAIVR